MKNVLVLGADGLVGRTVLNYLQSSPSINAWGTTRNKKRETKNKKLLTVKNYARDIQKIQTSLSLSRFDCMINCIGLLKDFSSVEELIQVNSLFPHQLESFAEKNKSFLIHISTDAVYSPRVEAVDEYSLVCPIDLYGKSKVAGETQSSSAITIRSSFLGFEPIRHHGLLENISYSRGILTGYINQKWCGCTSLQFAKFCESIITTNKFKQLRALSSVFHFTPIQNSSKYDVIKTYLLLTDSRKKLVKGYSQPVTRVLISRYTDILSSTYVQQSLKTSLNELLLFEKKQI